MTAVPLLRWGPGSGPLALLLAIALPACGGPQQADVIASWQSGVVTPAELDEMVRQLPAARRQPAAGESLADWIESRAAELALSRILQERAAADGSAHTPELELRARYEAGQEIGRGYLTRHCAAGEISDEELTRLFALAYPRASEEWILVRHIYKNSPPESSAGERETARRALEQLRSQLDSGASFGELARLHSDSETAKDGGLIGRVSRRAPIEPRVRDAAWALADGSHSQVVEVSNGFHLLLRERSGTATRPRLDQVREELAQTEILRRREACGKEILSRLDADSPVTIDRAALLDPDDETRVALQVGEETFTARQLAGLSGDSSPLMHTPRPGQLLRHFSEAVLLVEAALAENPALEETYSAARSQAYLRLSNENRWREERLRAVEQAPEAELRAYFQHNIERFQTDLELDVGLITVSAAGQPGRRPAMERAQALRRRVDEGETFEAVAAAASEHGSREQAGRLGSLPLHRLRVILGSRGAARAAELTVGDVSAPIQIQDPPAASFALIKLYARTDPRPRSFDEARTEVVATRSQENVRQLDREVRERILAEVDFELHQDAIGRYISRLRG